MNLLSRRDVVVVASVSCIYGLGTPQSYLDRSVKLKVGGQVERDSLLRALVDVQYTRNDLAFNRGTFAIQFPPAPFCYLHAGGLIFALPRFLGQTGSASKYSA